MFLFTRPSVGLDDNSITISIDRRVVPQEKSSKEKTIV